MSLETKDQVRKNAQKNPFSELIKNLANEFNGFLALEKRLRDTVGSQKNPIISRKQLAKIAHGDDLPLRMEQLHALDTFLRKYKSMNLGWIFNPTSILNEVASHGDIAFVLGSQPDENSLRIDISRWDLRVIQTVFSELHGIGYPIRFAIEDVIFRGNQAIKFAEEEVPKKETWYHLVNADYGPSIFSIGSSKANHCNEIMLSKFFDVEPFKDWPKDRDRPFAFVWPVGDQRADDITSAFSMSPKYHREALLKVDGVSEETLDDLHHNGEREGISGFVFQGKFFAVNRKDSEWKSYAVIAAQKLERRVHICVVGLTGPATLGASKLLSRFTMEPLENGASVAWAAVEISVARGETNPNDRYRRDERHVADQRLLTEILYYN